MPSLSAIVVLLLAAPSSAIVSTRSVAGQKVAQSPAPTKLESIGALLRQHKVVAWWAALWAVHSELKHLHARAVKRRRLTRVRALLATDTWQATIITTAALPWMTGTAVNPLLRAAYLARERNVTLALPWLHPKEQGFVFGARRFPTPEAQEAFLLAWLERHADVGASSGLKLAWYAARYDQERGCAVPLGDLTRGLNSEGRDAVLVLEEPEHLTWHHYGAELRKRWPLVVGVVHTNYVSYARIYRPQATNAVRTVNQIVVRAHSDAVVKLSDTLQSLPRAAVCNVHGVRSEFLRIGQRAGWFGQLVGFRKGAYFIGKVLWAKGHRLLLDYLELEQRTLGDTSAVDVFGDGDDLEAVRTTVEERGLDVRLKGACDHASSKLRQYKVFVNPSRTEVLSTTTAEALAMGKFVLVQNHPSNAFFQTFANTLTYDTPEQFVQQLRFALASTPAPLTDDERHRLSWEGATQRFVECVNDAATRARPPSVLDHATLAVTTALNGPPGIVGDAVRTMTGGGPIARQSWMKQRRWVGASAVELVEESVRREPPEATKAYVHEVAYSERAAAGA